MITYYFPRENWGLLISGHGPDVSSHGDAFLPCSPCPLEAFPVSLFIPRASPPTSLSPPRVFCGFTFQALRTAASVLCEQ